MTQLKRTAIYPEYETLGAKTMAFGGWDLPVQFSSIMKEHEAARRTAALFDVSHMGEIFIEGADSLPFLQKVVTNNVAHLAINQAQYTLMCLESGGVIDDFLIYKLGDDKYMLVVNAANVEKDMAWLEQQRHGDVSIQNRSDDFALLAIQGPRAEKIVQKTTASNLSEIKAFRFKQDVEFEGIKGTAILSRTGYTGEDGFEIYINQEEGRKLWQLLLAAGEGDGLLPAGLGARDSLRLEAGLPLYGQELSETITPIEAGLQFAVKTTKQEAFIGKDSLLTQKNQGIARALVGLEMVDKGIARADYDVLDENDHVIGVVTTGTQSPTLQKAIAFAYIDRPHTAIGTEVFVQVRKRKVKAIIIERPFYKRKK